MFALVQKRIFNEFYSFTFPSDFMNIENFSQAIENKLNPNETNRIKAYFRAFDAQKNEYLTFSDYLIGKNNSKEIMNIN